MGFRVAKVLLAKVAVVLAALQIDAAAMDPELPEAAGVVGIDLETGEFLWGAWEKDAVPAEYRDLIADELFEARRFDRTRNHRPVPARHVLAARSDEFSSDFEYRAAYQGDLIRKKNGVEFSRKTVSYRKGCVNSFENWFYYLDPKGILEVHEVSPPDEAAPWKPIRSIQIAYPLTWKMEFLWDGDLDVLVHDGRIYARTPENFTCFEKDGELIWESSLEGFRSGGPFTGGPSAYFRDDRLLIHDSDRMAAFDVATGRKQWEAPMHLGVYHETCAIFPADGKVGIFSTEYYLGGPYPWAYQFTESAAQYPGNPKNVRRESVPPELDAAQSQRYLAYLAELRAFGTRAMQVLLRKGLDDSWAVPVDLKEEVAAILESEWPEFRSEERRRKFFFDGLTGKVEGPFDRIRAWKEPFRWISEIGGSETPDFTKDPADWGSQLDPTMLHPEWPPYSALHDLRFPIPRELIREARRILKTGERQEQYLAACVLVRSAGQPGSLTEEEVRQWDSGSDSGLKFLSLAAWAHFADRSELVERIRKSDAGRHRQHLLKLLAAKYPGDPDAEEIRLWLDLASQRGISYYVDLFRERRDGDFPADFEKAVRSFLRAKLRLRGKLVDEEATIASLDAFKNPDDDAFFLELLKEPHPVRPEARAMMSGEMSLQSIINLRKMERQKEASR